MNNDGRWAGEQEHSDASQSPSVHVIHQMPVSFTQEYAVLAEVCANMSSGFMLLNHHERVTYSNVSAWSLLQVDGYEQHDAASFDVRHHLQTIAGDPVQAQIELERLWQYPEQDYSAELALAGAAASWLRVRSFPVRDLPGHLLGRGLLFDDITLEHAATEARGETLALAAHELKTPLAIIKGCATTLLGSSARWDPAMQREMLQMIDTQSDRLYDMLNTLLDMWRFDAGAQILHLKQVFLPEMLHQLMERWRKQYLTYRFTLHVSPEMRPVSCDAVRVEQVLQHLLNNATTYATEGSMVRVHAEANDVEVRVSVADEGIGIASEHLDRVFDRFYRVEQGGERKGSGLGLASARATIEAHGGKIWADSAGLGRGTVVSFTLPFVPRSASLLSRTPEATEPAYTGEQISSQRVASIKHDRRIRVLLAENDARTARYLRANLEEQQYRVQALSHGIQTLRQLDLEEPDVIILSTRLADMKGVELLQRLREFSRCPVIMLCENCDEDERVQLFDLGSDDLVIKPFGMKELLARVRALLRRQVSPAEQHGNRAIFASDDLVIDYAQHQVTVQGRVVQLSRTEYKLLSTLAQNVGMVVTHELLLEKVWGPEYNRDIDFIWVYISRLRRKIEADSRHPRYILTIPDVGYKLAKL